MQRISGVAMNLRGSEQRIRTLVGISMVSSKARSHRYDDVAKPLMN